MRIAIAGPAHPYKGGGARHTTELAHRLAAAGHDVVIESWRAQYPARLYPGQQTVDEAEGTPFAATARRLAWYRPDGWFACGRRLRAADLVVVVLITPIQVPAYLVMLAGLRRRRRNRVVVLCHNVLPHERRPGDVMLTRALLRRAGAVLAHSAAEAEAVRALAPTADVRTASLPPHLPQVHQESHTRPAYPATTRNSRVPRKPRVRKTYPELPGDPKVPDSPTFRAPEMVKYPDLSGAGAGGVGAGGGAGMRLLFFGIVRPYKGLDILLRAVAEVPGVTLTVAGEFWGGTARVEELVAELGLSDRVTLRPGYVPASAVPGLFAGHDVLVLPYREATASQNALLAFSHGLPVVATTAGALAEHVTEGTDGFTAAPGDVKDLTRALNLIREPGMLAKLRAGVRRPDPDSGWASYLAALTAPPAPPPLTSRREPAAR